MSTAFRTNRRLLWGRRCPSQQHRSWPIHSSRCQVSIPTRNCPFQDTQGQHLHLFERPAQANPVPIHLSVRRCCLLCLNLEFIVYIGNVQQTPHTLSPALPLRLLHKRRRVSTRSSITCFLSCRNSKRPPPPSPHPSKNPSTIPHRNSSRRSLPRSKRRITSCRPTCTLR